MSKISFELSKNFISCKTDDLLKCADDESAKFNTNASLWIDLVEVATCEVNDQGGVLTFDGDLQEGEHMIEIRSTKGDSADIHIDKLLIDEKICLPTQFDIENVIWGHISANKFLTVDPFVKHHDSDYVWWGEVYDDNNVYNSFFYRPHLVSDLGFNWRWYINVKTNGVVWWNHCYDRLTNDDYYLATHQTPFDQGKMIQQFEQMYRQIMLDENFDWSRNHDGRYSWIDEEQDLITIAYNKNWFFKQNKQVYFRNEQTHEWILSHDDTIENFTNIKIGYYKGPGTYDHNFNFLSDNLDEEDISKQQLIVLSFAHFVKSIVNKFYYESYEFEPLCVSVEHN